MEKMRFVPGLTLIGTAAKKTSVLSFVLQGQDTQEVGKALDREGIAVRAGHHCAQPILRRFGLAAFAGGGLWRVARRRRPVARSEHTLRRDCGGTRPEMGQGTLTYVRTPISPRPASAFSPRR